MKCTHAPIALGDRLAIRVVGAKKARKLCYTCVDFKVPRCPHRVGVSWRKCRRRVRGTVVVLHDALGQGVIAEECGDEEVLPEKLLEHLPG